MKFLYFRRSPHLENLCLGWHFSAGHEGATRSNPMMDILMLALAAAFFALAIGYTYACERL